MSIPIPSPPPANESGRPDSARSWPDYRAVWRWHFYAGLFCIPFVLLLSITGGMYLFKPQFESWNDQAYDNLVVVGQPASAADQIKAALAAVPDSSFSAYEIPPSDRSAVRVIVRDKGGAIRVYVHPQTLAVLHAVAEEDRFMRFLFKLHGELLMGDRGSMVVELAASWTIVMILTGVYLWWPRQAKGLGGVLYPRIGGGSRVFWRDIHAVTGIWISAFALILLVSGLPWAKFWGDYFKAARRFTNTAVARQDWPNGHAPASQSASSPQTGTEHSEHHMGSGGGGAGGWRRGGRDAGLISDFAPVDRIVATVRPLQLPPPVVIAAPSRDSIHWTAKSITPNRPLRVDLDVNGATGQILNRKDFKDRNLIDQIVGAGVAMHEGQLFGWVNQLLGLLTALGLVLVSVSSVILWWKRRDQGVLGAPRVALDARFSWGLALIVILLGVYLPLFGGSLLLVLLLEKTVFRRIPAVRDWLGLRADAIA